MKKIALFLFFVFSATMYCSAQELPNLKQVKLNKKSHYKDVEPTVLNIVNYLFATPIDKKNRFRAQAGEFLLKWMNGTSDYVFHLEEKETNYFNTDSDLMLMYMAGLTKYSLANPSIKEQETIVLGSLALVLPYLNQQRDKKSWSSALWQLNDANQKGELASFLDQ